MDWKALYGRVKRRFRSRNKSALCIIVAFLLYQEKNFDYEWGRISCGVVTRIISCDHIIEAYKRSKPIQHILLALICEECSARFKSAHFKEHFRKNKPGNKSIETDFEWDSYVRIFEFCISELKYLGFIDEETELELIYGVEKIRFDPDDEMRRTIRR